ncbi:hypothetical protein CDD80_7380 [Ophiocordyceps camponoti-rufipedis]|uniref:Peptidase S1 domain-containing protein n=1 Tax=Ophiocordyceps camponoti-rufipedis TaxID=2004952 RepID=A0A2C5YLZ1_9HYPO|nr:hypothetical protein CDD80_7380 [Ophiocordyceps camponoti-rufipedis]
MAALRRIVSTAIFPMDNMGIGRRNKVLKWGSSSGFTSGRVNPVVSVTRSATTKNGPHFIALEWPIVAFRPALPFSAAGDSGSCVWTAGGEVVGMITGGLGRVYDGLHFISDVTYITPMQWLMDDFEACGLEVEIA